MITCFIRYQIEPTRVDAFERYARCWNAAIPRCGADLIGYFAPHEGSATTAYGLYSLPDLAAYERYRARLRDGPLGGEAFRFARAEDFIRREDRLFLRRITGLAERPPGEDAGLARESTARSRRDRDVP